jgi:quercetin dioxygenase-like cupin family protein
MSMAYLAQPDQQQLEWLDGGTLAMLLDGKATDGQLMVGRFDVSRGEAPPYHLHTREDEVFMLIKGTVLVWYDDQQTDWPRAESSSCPRTFRTHTASRRSGPTC